ncbi:hypothetical protein KKG66_08115 [bacterium]|nr:hypothetical protein [bacterium]
MRFVCLLLLVSALIAMAGDEDWAVVPDSLDSAKAKKAIDEIREQCLIFYMDRGRAPESVKELIDSKYVVGIDSATLTRWEFRLGFSYPTSITARPKVSHTGSGEKTRIGSTWWRQHTVTYDFLNGHWGGPGFPYYGTENLTEEQKSELVIDAQEAIENIALWTSVFLSDRGRYPHDMKEMRDNGYGVITPAVYVQWDLQLVGSPPTQIKAISSHIMPEGQGKVLIYDIETEKFSGYGVDE